MRAITRQYRLRDAVVLTAAMSLISTLAIGLADRSAAQAAAAQTPKTGMYHVRSAAQAATARTWKSGVFHGYGPTGDLQFATWRGSAIQTATDFIGGDDWSQIENPAWHIAAWRPVPAVQPVLTIQLWPATGGSLTEAASGAYNAHFATMAKNLVAGGPALRSCGSAGSSTAPGTASPKLRRV
jgi:hypothetical protein